MIVQFEDGYDAAENRPAIRLVIGAETSAERLALRLFKQENNGQRELIIGHHWQEDMMSLSFQGKQSPEVDDEKRRAEICAFKDA